MSHDDYRRLKIFAATGGEHLAMPMCSHLELPLGNAEVSKFPDDEIIPEIYIQLGIIYRDMGAFRIAIARFYGVPFEESNSALKTVEPDVIQAVRGPGFNRGTFIVSRRLYSRSFCKNNVCSCAFCMDISWYFFSYCNFIFCNTDF